MKYTAKIQKHLNVYAWGWYTGMTQRDGMGREEGGGRRVQDEEHMYTCLKIQMKKNDYNAFRKEYNIFMILGYRRTL